MSDKKKIMIVVGEASGDSHAADLVKAIQKKLSGDDVEFFGSTGTHLRENGVETVVKADELSIMGLLEIGKALPMFWNVFKTLKKTAVQRKPDVVILVDFPEFNLKLAKSLKKLGFKIIYYVSPQLWGWRSYRVKQIKKYVDLLLAILPFEKKWYADRGVHHVEFIGHPMVGEVKPKLTKHEFCQKHNLDKNKPIVALLPGSRRKEVSKILPPMSDAVLILNQKQPEIQFVIATAPNRQIEEIKKIISSKHNNLTNLKIVHNETREAVASADAAVVASGTATLETGLLHTPLVIVYKVAPHNYHTLRHLINVPHYGLINLIAEERLAQEFIQHDCNGEKIADEVLRLLESDTNQQFREKLKEVTAKLGDGGASEKAAELVLKFLE